MSAGYNSLPLWAKNVLQVYPLDEDYNPYKYWYEFLRFKLDSIQGDIVEVGVYRGRTLCTTAYVSSLLDTCRTVVGFDSFSGFPDTSHPKDDPDLFHQLFRDGSITPEHYQQFLLNLELSGVLGRSLTTGGLSSSGNFSATSQELVESKLRFLGLSNYRLVDGDIASTMTSANLPDTIAAIFLDADLYEPYYFTLKNAWPKLSVGGIIFLDEYYSLKFPGPRIAVNEFLASTDDARLRCIEDPCREFQRWIIQKH
tara:strand:- start:777 stop:1541 length:765 start_codon:yes stop_codon:yes gene_type:complete